MNLTKNSLITPGHFYVYGIAITLAISAFFVEPLEPGFHSIGEYLYFGFSLKQSLLFIANLILTLSIYGRAYNDDERIEKIKNHLRSHILFSVISSIALIGLLSSLHSILLTWLIILQIHYIVLYWICVYRDPEIIYMDAAQTRNLSLAIEKKFKLRYIPFIILGMGAGFIRDHHREFLALWFFLNLELSVFARSIYVHLKS